MMLKKNKLLSSEEYELLDSGLIRLTSEIYKDLLFLDDSSMSFETYSADFVNYIIPCDGYYEYSPIFKKYYMLCIPQERSYFNNVELHYRKGYGWVDIKNVGDFLNQMLPQYQEFVLFNLDFFM